MNWRKAILILGLLVISASAGSVLTSWYLRKPTPVPVDCPQTNDEAVCVYAEIRRDVANTVTLVGTTPSGCKIWQVEGPRMIVPLVFVESCNGHVATR